MKEKILDLLKQNNGYVSGQEISDSLGVSRTAIWKAIKALEAKGYIIEGVRNKGYRLVAEPDSITPERVAEKLNTQTIGSEVVVFDTIDSTNNEIKRRAEAGAAEGLLVIGEEQTAGRGRRGRVWESAKGTGLYMSLLLKPDIALGNASMLTLVMGMAVRDAIAEVAGIDSKIKWPNDVVYDGKKLCGILTEMSAQIDYINYIVIGTGINCHQESFPDEIRHMASSILMVTGKRISRAELAASAMNYFEKYYNIYLKTQDLTGLVDTYNSYLANAGREVRVLDPLGEYDGKAIGINNIGELLVETADGIKNVMAGEVSVRGIYGYV